VTVQHIAVLATKVQPDGSGGEIKLLHCNGVKGADGPNQHVTTPGQPDLTDHGETGAIRAACSRMSLQELSTLTFYTSTERMSHTLTTDALREQRGNVASVTEIEPQMA
jgi:hypothetical protein